MRQAVLQDCSEPDVHYKALKDYEDLFLGNRRGHLTEYVYYGDVDYYEKLVKEKKDYYPTHSEIGVLAKYGHEIANILGEHCNVVEIGPGSDFILKTKVLPLLRKFKNLDSYTAIDINLPYAQEASNLVKHELKTIECFAHRADFTEQLPRHYDKNTCLMFLGNTLSNFPNIVIYKLFQSFYELLDKDGYLMFALDYNEDLRAIRKAYDNVYLSGLAFNIMHYFKNSFIIEDFDPEKFKFEYEWSHNENSVHINLVATEEQMFDFNYNKVIIRPGQKYHLITSRKFNKVFIENVLRQTGLSIIRGFTDDKKSMMLYLVKKRI